MKRKRFRYTEYHLNMDPSTPIGWVKMIIAYVVVAPIRLINEITQKAVFLGKKTLMKICIYAFVLNLLFLGWSYMWTRIREDYVSFIPFPVMITSTVITLFVYMYLGGRYDFIYEVLEPLDEELEGDIEEFDAAQVVAFDKTEAAEVSWDDSINIFIRDPDELKALGISAVDYHAAEDMRLLNAIEQKADVFPHEKIEIPSLLDEPPLGTQLAENFNALMAQLEQQIVQ